MAAKITAQEQNLGKIFSDDYLFEIPLYQRPYAWTTEEVEELLDDLTDALNRDSKEPYFLGSLVLVKDDGQAKSEVIDGQQRLTTLTMLLCVLRELSGNRDNTDDLDQFVRQAGSEAKGTEEKFRLSLRELDKKFFRSNVQSRGNLEDFLKSHTKKCSDSQKHIFENAKLLKEKLGDRSEAERKELTKYVIQNCYLVAVSASDVESAHRIFSVMNARGLPLYPTDILKAIVIGKTPDGAKREYAEKWEGIEQGLGRDNFRDLFAHIRMIYRKDKLRGTLQKEFQEHVLDALPPGDLSPEKAMVFVDTVLEPYSDVYETVSGASYQSSEGAEKVNTPLRHLGRLDNFDWIPVAMAYYHNKEGQRGNLIQFTNDLERLAYGLFICRAGVNERINRYAEILKIIEQHGELFEETSPLQLKSAEKAEILTRLNGDIYNQPRVPMPLLLRLDSLLADAEADYAPRAISMEHVLPQSPADKSQWIKWFPDADERSQWTHRLANLVLLSRRKNTQASNYDFERKKSEYFQKNGTTTFALTTQVVNESEWTPAVLERRQDELIGALKKEWRLG